MRKQEVTAIRPRVEADGFTSDQVALIKRTMAEGATDDELRLFLYQCHRSGLDPLSRQIYFVKRKGRGTIQTGIDGYRAIADATGQYAGNDDPVFDEWREDGAPGVARVTVYKLVGGQRCAFTASARWEEYWPGEGQDWAWKKMPHVMLGKCAEALALRKAFPKQLSGLYTTEEMAQADQAAKHAVTVEAEAVAHEYGVTAPVGTKAAADQVAQAKLAARKSSPDSRDIIESQWDLAHLPVAQAKVLAHDQAERTTRSVTKSDNFDQPDLAPALEKSNAVQQLAKGLGRTLCQVPPNSERWVQAQDELARLMNWKPSEVPERIAEAMEKAQKDLDAAGKGLVTSAQIQAFWTVVHKHKWGKDRAHAELLDKFGVGSATQIPAAKYEDVIIFFDREPPEA